MKSKTLKRYIYPLYPIVLIVILWEGIYAISGESRNLFPPPSVFFSDALESDFKIGIGSQAVAIPISILSSIVRVIIGLLISFIASIVVGFLISTTGRLKSVIMPIIGFLSPIAPIAWIPTALIVFGIGNAAAIFIVFMGVFFMLTIATVDALERVPENLINKARTRGASPRQLWSSVRIPIILPHVISILRLNFIAAWMAVLAAEMTGLNDGLGNIFMTGRNLFDNKLIMLGMFLIAVIGYFFDLGLKKLQQVFFW